MGLAFPMNATRFSKLCALASLPCFFFAPLPCAQAGIQHVIAISVDGCRGDFLQTFIETTPANFPNFVRLRNASAYTYNARPDFAHTVTIPDHLCMLTGRPVDTRRSANARAALSFFTASAAGSCAWM